LPFHAAVGGIQTSNRISESAVGLAVASTRQNDGSVMGFRKPGGVNGPAGTDPADVIVTFGIVNAFRSVQEVLKARDAMIDRIMRALVPWLSGGGQENGVRSSPIETQNRLREIRGFTVFSL
jgi:hypothetical protein